MDVNNVYPRLIIGDPFLDDFADANPMVKLTNEYNDFVAKHGKELASKILWCFYILIDPTSFIYTRTSYEERLSMIKANFYADFVPEKLRDFLLFYESFILKDTEVLHYGMAKKRFEIAIQHDTKMSVTKMSQDRDALREWENTAFRRIETAIRIQIQGSRQPGRFASLIDPNFAEKWVRKLTNGTAKDS